MNEETIRRLIQENEKLRVQNEQMLMLLNEQKKEQPTLKHMDGEFARKTQDIPKPLKEQPKEGFLKKLWNKTIFPDMIKAKKEEKEWKRQIEYEAKRKAREDSFDEIVEIKKKEQLAKMTGQKKNDFLQKLSDGFAGSGEGIGSTEKMNQLLGVGTNNNVGVGSTERMNQMLGRQQQQQQQPNPEYQYVEVKPKKKKVYKRVVKQKPQQPNQNDYFGDRLRRML